MSSCLTQASKSDFLTQEANAVVSPLGALGSRPCIACGLSYKSISTWHFIVSNDVIQPVCSQALGNDFKINCHWTSGGVHFISRVWQDSRNTKNGVMQPIQCTLIKSVWVPGLVLHEVAYKTELCLKSLID